VFACSAAYERSQPVFNYELNGCGTTYINIGDGGVRELADMRFKPCAVLPCCLSKLIVEHGRMQFISAILRASAIVFI
jgi:hypothetical protein